MKQRFIFSSLLAAVFCLALYTNVNSQNDVMTNDEVISLTKAGLSQAIIIGKIRTGKSNFDLSTHSLIKLKQSGVSDDVVSAMLEAKSGKSTAAAPGPSMSGDPN